VHVLAPHPPLFLDASCNVIDGSSRLRRGSLNTIGEDPTTASARADGYVEQVQCVNRFLRRLTQSLSSTDALVFVTGDHGSNTLGQFETDPDDWSDAQIVERMSTLVAVKPTEGCDVPESSVTVAALRDLVSCAGGVDLGRLEERAFLLSLSGIRGDALGMRSLEAVQLRLLATCLTSGAFPPEAHDDRPTASDCGIATAHVSTGEASLPLMRLPSYADHMSEWLANPA